MTTNHYSVKSFDASSFPQYVQDGVPVADPDAREAYWAAAFRRENAKGRVSRYFAERSFRRAQKKLGKSLKAESPAPVVARGPVLPTRAELAKTYKLGPIAHVFKLIWGAVFSHVGLLIVVALYYLLFETTPEMKHLWDNVICPNSHLRHEIRNVGEGVLGAFLAKGIMWNRFTKSHQKAGRIFDFLHDRLRIPATFSALLSTAALFASAFWFGTTLLHDLSIHASSGAVTGSLWHRTATLWNSNWDQKALGFLCAFLATRPMHSIFDDVQGYFAGRRVTLGKKARFWYPRAFKNRIAYLQANPTENRAYASHVSFFMRLGVFVGIGLAGYGYYILTYVA